MQLFIEEARTSFDLDAVRHLETCIFEREKGVTLPPLQGAEGDGKIFRLLARVASSNEPVATLSVVEGRPNYPGLLKAALGGEKRPAANGNERVARYTRMAVRSEFRGHSLCLRLMLEAQRRFVGPEGIHKTWLLFNAERASSSLLAMLLGFTCDSQVIRSEYGRCRLLSRDELTITAHNSNRRAWAYLAALDEPSTAAERESLFAGDEFAREPEFVFPPAA
jgi:hypothetical protein